MDLFARRLRDRATTLGLAAAEVARRVGLSERRYTYYAAGTREPDLATLVRIAEVLAVTPNDLLLEDKISPAPDERDRLMAKLDATVSTLDVIDLELAVAQLECLLAFRRRRGYPG